MGIAASASSGTVVGNGYDGAVVVERFQKPAITKPLGS
jgi:hypothetical protein